VTTFEPCTLVIQPLTFTLLDVTYLLFSKFVSPNFQVIDFDKDLEIWYNCTIFPRGYGGHTPCPKIDFLPSYQQKQGFNNADLDALLQNENARTAYCKEIE